MIKTKKLKKIDTLILMEENSSYLSIGLLIKKILDLWTQ